MLRLGTGHAMISGWPNKRGLSSRRAAGQHVHGMEGSSESSVSVCTAQASIAALQGCDSHERRSVSKKEADTVLSAPCCTLHCLKTSGCSAGPAAVLKCEENFRLVLASCLGCSVVKEDTQNHLCNRMSFCRRLSRLTGNMPLTLYGIYRALVARHQLVGHLMCCRLV